MTRLPRVSRIWAGIALACLLAVATTLAPAATFAHGPDPLIPGSGNLWDRDQVVPYQWALSGVPPSWAATAIDLGAGDVAESRNSRAATFTRVASAPASMSYGAATGCDTYGIACMNRTGMDSGVFRVWFRPQGWAFDWGTLKWCQWYDSAPNGCYDIENTSLDELGHVEVLGHHVNFADESDFTDAVVQYAGHTKPRAGWNQHVFGRCDVATLQLQYERRDPGDLVSTCLSLPTTTTMTASTDTVVSGTTVRFTSTLRLAANTVAVNMSNDPLSDRPLVLQRRALGSTTWVTVGTMTPSATGEGWYSMSVGPTATYDWRALWPTPTNEGVLGSVSATIRVSVTTCTGGGCPLLGPAD